MESSPVPPGRAEEALTPNQRFGTLPQPGIHVAPPAPPACILRTHESCHHFPACPRFAIFEETDHQSQIPHPMPLPNLSHPPASVSRQPTAPFSALGSIFP